MKKSLILFLSIMLVLGFTVSAFAIHAEIPAETQSVVAKGTTQITLGGALRFRGDMRSNTGDFNDDRADNMSAYDGRVRLSLDAQVSPNTMGRIQLETGSVNADTYTWGCTTSDTCGDNEGTYGEGNAKKGTLDVLEAWIQHTGSGLLGMPAGIKIGHMPLKLGHGLFFNHTKFGDDAVVVFVDPTKELHVALLDIKLTENTNTNTNAANSNNNSDDTDAYVALFSYQLGNPTTISGDVTLLNDQNASADGLNLWNIGLRGDTKVAGFGIKADVELQTGKAKAPGTDTKYSGYAVLLGADYALDMVTLDVAFAMGSGDSDANDNKVKTFQTAQGSSQKFTYVYDYRTRTAGVNAPSTGASALGATDTGIANTTYYKIGASAKPMKDLSANVDLYLLRATKAVSTSSTYKSKDIGVELDGKVKYNIDRNLVYFIEAGYLWADDLYKNITESAKNPDAAYAVRHGVELTF